MEFVTVKASPKSYEDVMEYIFSKLKKQPDLYPSPEKVIKDIRLACEEIFLNIVEYAYSSDNGCVEVSCEIENGDVLITMRDCGRPFNPLDVEEPDVMLAIDERGVGGLGIYIAKKIMDDIKYKRDGDRNVLTLKKKISRQFIYN